MRCEDTVRCAGVMGVVSSEGGEWCVGRGVPPKKGVSFPVQNAIQTLRETTSFLPVTSLEKQDRRV